MRTDLTGFVEFWADNGWGFVFNAEGEKFFAHIRAFEPALPLGVYPVKGTIVSFDEGKTTRGPVALNIKILSRVSA